MLRTSTRFVCLADSYSMPHKFNPPGGLPLWIGNVLEIPFFVGDGWGALHPEKPATIFRPHSVLTFIFLELPFLFEQSASPRKPGVTGRVYEKQLSASIQAEACEHKHFGPVRASQRRGSPQDPQRDTTSNKKLRLTNGYTPWSQAFGDPCVFSIVIFGHSVPHCAW